ncbi:alpha-1,4-N-acetylgalactosamine transferase PglH [Bacillus sp. JCM 19045]|nr:alpha-1,4-N-acetylgalactosamine transferase PglH [Bacillus sp. JCM 19045]
MKIVFVLYSLETGGVERMTLHLAEDFLKRGYQVDLLVFHLVGDYINQVPAGVEIIHLSKQKARNAIPAMISYFRKRKPDVIISAKDYLNVLVIVAKKCSGTSGKLIVSSRVHLSEQARLNPSTKKMKKWVARTYRFTDHVVGVSNGVAEDIKAIAHLPTVHTIYNPVVTGDLQAKMTETADHPYFSEANKKVFLTVGRLHPQKDYTTLIRAFAHVRSRIPEARLLFVGDGEERTSLQTAVDENGLTNDVSFVGFQNNPYAYIKQADVFVLSSLYEGFGNVLVEALAAGTTIVSTDCPSGPREILAEGAYGHIVPVGDPVELAHAMEKAFFSQWNRRLFSGAPLPLPSTPALISTNVYLKLDQIANKKCALAGRIFLLKNQCI